MTADEFAAAAIELFESVQEYLGLSDARFPVMEPQTKQCDYEDAFNELICRYLGHDIEPDQCGKPEHDLCYRCKQLREDIEKGEVSDVEQMETGGNE